jgi:hypothetical protein
MYECSFELNNQPMSEFKIAGTSFPAFSGTGSHVNQRTSICLPSVGPIPPGRYYIFDRQSGGLFGGLRDAASGHAEWFALYAIDSKIDDEVLCNQIKRGNFRLHPKVGLGVSKGCITLKESSDYQFVRQILKNSAPMAVPGSALKAYGRVWVK